jgi:hypothetical protein
MVVCAAAAAVLTSGCDEKDTSTPAPASSAPSAPAVGDASVFGTSRPPLFLLDSGLPAPLLSALAADPPALPARGAVPELTRDCQDICQLSQKLHCSRADDCMSSCVSVGQSPCAAEMLRLFRCAVYEPPSHWKCADDGMAAIRPGYCDKEQEHTFVCMQNRM